MHVSLQRIKYKKEIIACLCIFLSYPPSLSFRVWCRNEIEVKMLSLHVNEWELLEKVAHCTAASKRVEELSFKENEHDEHYKFLIIDEMLHYMALGILHITVTVAVLLHSILSFHSESSESSKPRL